MRKCLLRILSEYGSEKQKPFNSNALAHFIRNNPADDFFEATSIDNTKYTIRGSAGQSNWAEIPWIALFDNDITSTAQKGYDIVFLFCADMSGVYLSLNQGWTYFKEKYGTKQGKEKIRTVAHAWKKLLSSSLNDFSYNSIDLKGKLGSSSLATGYELGHICGKYYEADNLPSEEALIRDFNNLVGVYRELKGKMRSTIEETNDSLIVQSILGEFFIDSDDTVDDKLVGIDSTIEKSSLSTLEEVPVPSTFIPQEKTYDFIPSKTNYIKKARDQKKLGYAGELMVIELEKKRLSDLGKKHLSNTICHVSKEKGDGAGYDILSFHPDGSPKYIEVKTTTGNINTPFYLTDTELEFAKKKGAAYYLYRVFNYNAKNNSGKYYIINGNGLDQLSLRVETYVVNGIRNHIEGV